ncbi:hypothetical protein BDW02DRAFT_603694 [Decorospora gaudefroyi]|uniref:Uncharacterized protein n=1 Tax=Decorospora gaudefroyi TaxID=184978 RepID=A0A6A5JV53_9PLEO|nr:hypothetical protein BDW02DRAFT_603694 [Decorospora gaudefroyi]
MRETTTTNPSRENANLGTSAPVPINPRTQKTVSHATANRKKYPGILPINKSQKKYPEKLSLAPPDLHKTLVNIVQSDARSILEILPSYTTLTFSYNKASNTPTLHLGECGDSQVLAYPDGTVQKIVIRSSAIRKAGLLLDVRKPMGEQFKPVAPFGWSLTLQSGICTPMSAPAHALVLMFMRIWAIKEGRDYLSLSTLDQRALYEALVSVRKALEMEKNLAVKYRKIPETVAKAYFLKLGDGLRS